MAKPMDALTTSNHDTLQKCRLCGQRSRESGMPCSCRWKIWTDAVQLWRLELPVNYQDLLRNEGPEDRQIELDICRTFPYLPAFDASKEQKLGRVLRAYASLQPDVGYCQGMNFVAGLLILASDNEEESFRVLVCLMDKYNLAGFYRASFPLLQRYVVAADRLLLSEAPVLHAHLHKQGVHPNLYMHEWFLALFVDCMPSALVLDVFQAIMQEGLYIIIPIAVSILRGLEETLVKLRFEGIF